MYQRSSEWSGSWKRKSRRTLDRAERRRTRSTAALQGELLEDRRVMATFTWTGAVNGSWANTGNWLGGSAPVAFQPTSASTGDGSESR